MGVMVPVGIGRCSRMGGTSGSGSGNGERDVGSGWGTGIGP